MSTVGHPAARDRNGAEPPTALTLATSGQTYFGFPWQLAEPLSRNDWPAIGTKAKS
jgi:hypothetical protein